MVVSAPVTKYRVLVIEEEALLRLILEDILCEFDYEVIVSGGTFEEAMQSARDAQCDVAILHMRIQGMLTFPVAAILA
jgi:DNA-binding NarL/FixJ family response regulator